MVTGFSGEMKVEFLKQGVRYGFGYHVGEVAEFEDKQAKELIEIGLVKEIETEVKKVVKKAK